MHVSRKHVSIFSAFAKNIIAIASNGIRDKITKLEEVQEYFRKVHNTR